MTWKLFSLVSVSVAFLALVVWVYMPRNKKKFDAYASIPLLDDSNSHCDRDTAEEKP